MGRQGRHHRHPTLDESMTSGCLGYQIYQRGVGVWVKDARVKRLDLGHTPTLRRPTNIAPMDNGARNYESHNEQSCVNSHNAQPKRKDVELETSLRTGLL